LSSLLQLAVRPSSCLIRFTFAEAYWYLFLSGAIEAAAAAESKKGGRRGGPVAVVEKSGPALRNAEMELRKCCNHPYLVDGIEDQVTPLALIFPLRSTLYPRLPCKQEEFALLIHTSTLWNLCRCPCCSALAIPHQS
jgi:hypothetical protein